MSNHFLIPNISVQSKSFIQNIFRVVFKFSIFFYLFFFVYSRNFLLKRPGRSIDALLSCCLKAQNTSDFVCENLHIYWA